MDIKPAAEASMFDPNDSGDILEATHKGVTMCICVDEDYVSIFSIESANENRGEAGEAIQELKKQYPDKELWGSVPLNQKTKHLFDKHGIKYEEDE